MDNLLELSNINLKFNNKQILNNFSLQLSDGDKVLISGNSGKGKSTIFRILLGFEVFDSGKYLINKKDISEFSFFDI
jgi:putative ABC transport system ATP-binding protein